jgi:hypothetical protein
MNTMTTVSPRQTFALFCATGKDWRASNLTREQVSAMLTACQAVRGNKAAALAICESFIAGKPLPPVAPAWQAIYDEACAAGKAAAEACKPVPMYVEGYSQPIMGGVCGFANVHFPDARKPFAKWLVKHKLASKGYGSGVSTHLGFDIGGQSLTIKEHYAHAFASVCAKHGIECRVQSRMD